MDPLTLLSTVAAAFDVGNRGCFLTLASDLWIGQRIKLGDRIQLRTPQGRILDTQIHSIEIASGTNGASTAIGLPAGFSKTDVPVGTEIWVAAGRK